MVVPKHAPEAPGPGPRATTSNHVADQAWQWPERPARATDESRKMTCRSLCLLLCGAAVVTSAPPGRCRGLRGRRNSAAARPSRQRGARSRRLQLQRRRRLQVSPGGQPVRPAAACDPACCPGPLAANRRESGECDIKMAKQQSVLAGHERQARHSERPQPAEDVPRAVQCARRGCSYGPRPSSSQSRPTCPSSSAPRSAWGC